MKITKQVKGILSLANVEKPLQGKWGPSYPNRILLDKEKDSEAIKEIRRDFVKLLKENPPTKEQSALYKRQKLSPKAILKDRFMAVLERSFKDGDSFKEDDNNYHENNFGKMLLETTSKTAPTCIALVNKTPKVIKPSMIGGGDKVNACVQMFVPKQSGSVSIKLISLSLISKWKPEKVDTDQLLKQAVKAGALDDSEDFGDTAPVGEEDLEDLGEVEEVEEEVKPVKRKKSKKAKKAPVQVEEDELSDEDDFESEGGEEELEEELVDEGDEDELVDEGGEEELVDEGEEEEVKEEVDEDELMEEEEVKKPVKRKKKAVKKVVKKTSKKPKLSMEIPNF